MITNPEKVTANNQVSSRTARLKERIRKTFPYLAQSSWQMWAIILIVFSGGLGFTAFSLLLMLPKTPNCPRVFWPIASASMRLYCAQLDAEQGTVDGLLRALELVEVLPPDHPLRPEINRNLEEWSEDLLNLADKDVQAGRIDQAINAAEKIPIQSKAHRHVRAKIARWQSIWSSGNKILAEVEQQLHESNWNEAFRLAIEILNLRNQYWSTIEYPKVLKKIQLAHEQSNQLDNAFTRERQGGLENWVKSIKEAQQIPPDSYAHKEAQDIIQKNKESIVNFANLAIERRDWKQLNNIVELTGSLNLLQEDVTNWQIFLNASNDAESDTPEGFSDAIVTLEQIEPKYSLYKQAQELIKRWKLEGSDVVYINKANELAKLATVNDYHNAILQLQQIFPGNPRYSQSRRLISKWQAAIQILEDQPILDRAVTIAQGEDILSFQGAISQARAISPDRALYKEAQNKIGQWQIEIEKIEDQPLLDRALSLAESKEYTSAIETAERISSGRALYSEAQHQIRRWHREIRATKDLDSAYQIAESKTPEALNQALNLVKDIPSSTNISSQAKEALNLWSGQLLNLAKDKADISSFNDAIRIAKLIPSESNVYSTARSQITIWEKELQPVPSSPSGSPLP